MEPLQNVVYPYRRNDFCNARQISRDYLQLLEICDGSGHKFGRSSPIGESGYLVWAERINQGA